MIPNKFAYFSHGSTYRTNKEGENISDNSIAFVGDDQSIATQGKIFGVRGVYPGTCTTEAGTAAKVATTSPLFPLDSSGKPLPGTTIAIKFSNTNTYKTSGTTMTLNVNSTGAYPIYYNNAKVVSTTSANTIACGYKDRYTYYIFNGTQWVWLSYGIDANTTYSNVALGQGYAVQNNSAASATITATLGSYALTANGIVSVKFTYDVPANATLNINGKGAKAIYNKDAAITAGVIKAGDTATFIYNTYYRLIAVDRWQDKQDALVSGTNLKTVNSTSLLGSGNVLVQPTLVSGTNIKTINNESLLGSGNITIESSSPTNIEYNSSKTALVIGGGSTKYTISLSDGEALYPNVEINDFTYPASRFPLEVNSGDNLNVVVSKRAVTCTTTMGGATVSTSRTFSIQSVSGNIVIKVAGPTGPSGPGGDGPGVVIDP